MRTILDDLSRERDELLAALKATLREYIESDIDGHYRAHEAFMSALERAIARAEGQP